MNCKTCDKKCEGEYCFAHKPKKPMKRTRIKQGGVKIAYLSAKRIVQEREYSKVRREFLSQDENKYCFISGCGKKATTIEHRSGRDGFYDEWARENNINKLNDVRFFAPCCWDHNSELENNPELSKEYQLSKIHGGKKE